MTLIICSKVCICCFVFVNQNEWIVCMCLHTVSLPIIVIFFSIFLGVGEGTAETFAFPVLGESLFGWIHVREFDRFN